ncbi:hypothetical protein [Streptomyces sp. NPDC012466]|jgi:hypothetical protein|uniref:hypothetical protein n=1 Tax=Streptomyces sp. NPDC012466 TaxID=3364835 RepID=UPI0036E109BF
MTYVSSPGPSGPPKPSPGASGPRESGPCAASPFLPLHTALVLLTAIVIGLIVAILTFLSGTPAAGAALAGLLSTGAGIPVLRTLIG